MSLTKSDIQSIRQAVREETKPEFDRLNEKIDTVDIKLTNRIDKVNTQLGKKITKLNKKLDKFFNFLDKEWSKLSKRINYHDDIHGVNTKNL